MPGGEIRPGFFFKSGDVEMINTRRKAGFSGCPSAAGAGDKVRSYLWKGAYEEQRSQNYVQNKHV